MFAVALVGIVLVPSARADQDNKEVRFKVNGPVEVPGRVLNPGRYDLRLMGNGSTVAGLWNAKGNKFYGYFDTIPVTREHRGHLRVELAGSGANAPKRLSQWFYPGDKTGNELIYSANKPVETASRTSPSEMANR